MAATCETTRTDSFESPVSVGFARTFPGASARRRLLVKGTTTTVAIRLRLKLSAWTMSTGLQNPVSLPCGTPKSAHQISPRVIAGKPPEVLDGNALGIPVELRFFVGLVKALGNLACLVIAEELTEGLGNKAAARHTQLPFELPRQLEP